MLRDAIQIACGVALVAALGSLVKADELAPKLSRVDRFSRPILLKQFDKDRDGELSLAERRELAAAFGGIEVPMLPAESYRYADLEPPSHLDPVLLSDLDNTPDSTSDRALLTDAGAALGRVLFYDRQLSANNTVACASCHLQQHGFSDPRRFSEGYNGGRTGRNAMGLINLRFTNINGSRPGFFWDERAATLEDQVLLPIQDDVEMGMELNDLEAKLQELPYYPALFAAAFGEPSVSSQRIAKAVAQFMRSMSSFESEFDRAAQGVGSDYSSDFPSFDDAENHGKSLFIDGVEGVGEIGCAHCHVPPTFSMPKSFNNGLDRVYSDPGLGARSLPPNDPFTPSNHGKFKAPSLRNIALTAPYMHDGRFKTLRQVVEHYSSGVHPHANLGLAFNEEGPTEASGTSGFRLSAEQISALVAFLKTLTDEAFVADPRFSDPFVRLNN
jgi:cytochrome c peroxidase